MSAVKKSVSGRGQREHVKRRERDDSWTQVQHIRVGQEITQEGQQVKDVRAHLKQNVTAIVQGNKNITELISCMQTNKAQADNACEDLLLFCLVLQIVSTLAGRLRMTFLLSFFFLFVCLQYL